MTEETEATRETVERRTRPEIETPASGGFMTSIKNWFAADPLTRGGLILAIVYLFGGNILPENFSPVDTVQRNVCSGYVAEQPVNRTPAGISAQPRSSGPAQNVQTIDGTGVGAPQQRLPN